VGQKWAHPERLSKRQGLPVAIFSQLGGQGTVLGDDVAEEPESPCLVSAFLAIARALQGTADELSRLIELSSLPIGLAQPGDKAHTVRYGAPGDGLLHRLFQEPNSLASSSRQGIGIARRCGKAGEVACSKVEHA
jgi:hypothetical protein